MQLRMKLLDEEQKINKLSLGEAEVASVWLLVQNVLKSHCECDLCILIGSPVTQKLYIGKLLTAENKWKENNVTLCCCCESEVIVHMQWIIRCHSKNFHLTWMIFQ